MAVIGYIRVSTTDQNSDLQRNALISINCDQIFEDKMSGKTAVRPGLKRALKAIQRAIHSQCGNWTGSGAVSKPDSADI